VKKVKRSRPSSRKCSCTREARSRRAELRRRRCTFKRLLLDLGGVAIGAFDDAGVKSEHEQPLPPLYWKGITTEVRSTKPPIAILTRQKGSTANVRLASSTA
jgi:hypothetical protein